MKQCSGRQLREKARPEKIFFDRGVIFQSSVLQTESKINAVKSTIHAGFTAFVFSQDFYKNIVWPGLVLPF
jgi:predicted ATPase